MRITVCIIFFTLLSLQGYSQKFKLGTSIGTSYILWHENQVTLDLGGQLTFQLPTKKYQIFAKLKALGNLYDSPANPNLLLHVDNTTNQPVQASYRGGQAETGIRWNASSGFSPSLALSSKSMARKLTTNQSAYLEEEKYALHGVNAGLAYKAQWKETSVELNGQIFVPLYQRITLYGELVGIPKSIMTASNTPSYQTDLHLRYKRVGLTLSYEIVNFGSPQGQSLNSIKSSHADILSSLLTFYF